MNHDTHSGGKRMHLVMDVWKDNELIKCVNGFPDIIYEVTRILFMAPLDVKFELRISRKEIKE